MDLRKERRLIQDMIIKMGHYPICMENFPSSPKEQTEYIAEQLDYTDLYLVIVGDRYGTNSADDNRSYTEREFDYARQIGLQPLVFIKATDPPSDNLTKEQEDDLESLKKFKKKLKGMRFVAFWNTCRELINAVSGSITTWLNGENYGWVREQKYTRILREQIDIRLAESETKICQIINDKNFSKSDIFDSYVDNLTAVYNDISSAEYAFERKLRIGRIILLLDMIVDATYDHNLSPEPIYKIAQIHRNIGLLDKALNECDLYQNLKPNTTKLPQVYVLLGLIYIDCRDYEKSQENFEKAISMIMPECATIEQMMQTITATNLTEIQRKLDLLAQAYNGLGVIFKNVGDIKAIENYNNAVNCICSLNKLSSKSNAFRTYKYYFNLADAYNFHKQYDQAELYIKEAITILEGMGTSDIKIIRLARSYQCLFEINTAKNGEYNPNDTALINAEKYYTDAIELLCNYLVINRLNFKEDLAWCYYKFAVLENDAGKSEKARDLMLRAIYYYQELTNNTLGQQNTRYRERFAKCTLQIAKWFYNSDWVNNNYFLLQSDYYCTLSVFAYESLEDLYPEIFKKFTRETYHMIIDINKSLHNDTKVIQFEQKLKDIDSAA